jgi:uncharacterized protein (DUF169 family)
LSLIVKPAVIHIFGTRSKRRVNMRPLQTDLSIFGKLDLEKPPVGVRFEMKKPEGIEQLDKKMALCEMLVEAQNRATPFYITGENETCFGKQALGMAAGSPAFTRSGEMGVRFELFQDARANKKLFQNNPGMPPGTVGSVIFSALDAIDFEPDLLIIMAEARQAEVVLRAMTYSTGDIYESKTATALSCGWLLAYPYMSGKVNYFITGLGFGAIGRKAFEPGKVLISIPYNWIPTIAQNLKEMKWEITAYKLDKEEFDPWISGILAELAREFEGS